MKRVVIIGAGIVGLATAFQLRRADSKLEITVVEKEQAIGLHQTGRNSGVIHSGVYYLPGSAKAKNCREGRGLLLDFCREFGVPHEVCGKVIVATTPDELPRLQMLLQRGVDNGVGCRRIGTAELAELEPHARGLEALHVEDAGIVDYRGVCDALAGQFGGRLLTGAEVIEIVEESPLRIETTLETLRADFLINCAGLQSDRVCKRAGSRAPLKIVPFKGEYFRVKEEAQHLCRHLIYPVPDPRFPFLGVHLTRMIDGGLEVGPNAVLALGREAYGKADFNLLDLVETLTYSGFLRLASRHWKMGFEEMYRSWSKKAFVKALNHLCPELKEEHLLPAPCGIRAQALKPDGSLEDDFRFVEGLRSLHVLNAPSPAATASLSIGRSVAEKALSRL